MHVFVTGATGYIGSALVSELIAAGHTVTGLARTPEAAAKLAAMGATPHQGELTDTDSLVAAAKEADAVLHLAFIHDFTQYAKSGQIDRQAIEAMTAVLAGKVFINTSGTLILASADSIVTKDATETDAVDLSGIGGIRGYSEVATVAAAERGVKSAVIRLPPTVHGLNDKGFIPMLIGTARKTGVSAYVGNGANRWPAVHRDDAARLYRLAMEQLADGSLKPGSFLHAVADTGVTLKDIATAIVDKLSLNHPESRETDHFGQLSFVIGRDNPTSSALTQKWTGWQPTGPSLLEDIRNPEYAKESNHA